MNKLLAVRGDIDALINHPTKFHRFLDRSDVYVYDDKHAIIVCRDPEHFHWANLLAINLQDVGFDVANFSDDFIEKATVPEKVDWDDFWEAVYREDRNV